MKKDSIALSAYSIVITACFLWASALQSQSVPASQTKPAGTQSTPPSVSAALGASSSEGIHWLTDQKVSDMYVSPMAEALKQSAKDGRPVIVYFTYDT